MTLSHTCSADHWVLTPTYTNGSLPELCITFHLHYRGPANPNPSYFSLTSGYQPILTKFSVNVAYFSKLNLTFLPKITNELISDICSEVVKILFDTCKYITRLPYPLRRIDTSSSINNSNQEMCYNDNDLSLLYCCLYCCFALLFLLLSLAYSHLCYHGVLLYSFLRVVLLVLVVALVVGCVPSTSCWSSSVVCRHPLAPSCCNHGVLLFHLCRVVSRCVVSFIVVLRSCSCCCPGIIAITVYCCFICFALCHVVLFLLLFVLLFCVVVLVVVLASLLSQCVVVFFSSCCSSFSCCCSCCRLCAVNIFFFLVVRRLSSSACPFLLQSRCIVVSFVSRCVALCRKIMVKIDMAPFARQKKILNSI